MDDNHKLDNYDHTVYLLEKYIKIDQDSLDYYIHGKEDSVGNKLIKMRINTYKEILNLLTRD